MLSMQELLQRVGYFVETLMKSVDVLQNLVSCLGAGCLQKQLPVIEASLSVLYCKWVIWNCVIIIILLILGRIRILFCFNIVFWNFIKSFYVLQKFWVKPKLTWQWTLMDSVSAAVPTGRWNLLAVWVTRVLDVRETLLRSLTFREVSRETHLLLITWIPLCPSGLRSGPSVVSQLVWYLGSVSLG